MPATLFLYADRVRIVANQWEALHPRKFAAHEGSTLAEHRAALVAAVSGKRGKRYLKRQQLLDLGAPVFLYLDGDRPSPAEGVDQRGGSALRHSRATRVRGFAASRGAGTSRAGLQCHLRGTVFAAFVGLRGGEEVNRGALTHHSARALLNRGCAHLGRLVSKKRVGSLATAFFRSAYG